MEPLKEFRDFATRRVSEMRTRMRIKARRSCAIVDHTRAGLCITRIAKQARLNLEEIDSHLEAAACERDVWRKIMQRVQRIKLLEQALNALKL